MSEEDWETGYAKSVGVFLNGASITTTDTYGGRIVDDSFFVMFNASDIGLPWTLPGGAVGREWIVELDSDLTHEPGTEIPGGGTIELAPRSMVVLRTPAPAT